MPHDTWRLVAHTWCIHSVLRCIGAWSAGATSPATGFQDMLQLEAGIRNTCNTWSHRVNRYSRIPPRPTMHLTQTMVLAACSVSSLQIVPRVQLCGTCEAIALLFQHQKPAHTVATRMLPSVSGAELTVYTFLRCTTTNAKRKPIATTFDVRQWCVHNASRRHSVVSSTPIASGPGCMHGGQILIGSCRV
jgi:hypothetical protein